MQRIASVALLIVLLVAPLIGQRGAVRGASGAFARPSRHFGGNIVFPQRGLFSRHVQFRQFHAGGPIVVPLWYGDGVYPYADPVVDAPVTSFIPPEGQPIPVATTPAVVSKLVEVPASAHTGAPQPARPVIFILTNGERLESQRYMLTAENLYITIDRRQRTIPLAAVDMNTTIVTNHGRGIDLRIPTDRNEITLAF